MSIKTEITVDTKKYFHGFSTIQLFDKDTGKLVKQVKHENTYNDRLPFINYLNTIVRKPSSLMHSTITGWLLNQDSYADTNNHHFFQYYARPGNNAGFFLFGNLLLTSNTEDENAHGYFNGIPVAYCNAGNILPTTDQQQLSCVGNINLNESYLGNDRLHLVFDFSTDKANITFDSLWLIPSQGIVDNCVPAATATEHILLSQQTTATLATTAATVLACPYIQGKYSVLYERNSSDENYPNPYSYIYSIRILDMTTGDIETYDLGTGYDLGGFPFYYDKTNKKLYTMFLLSDANAFINGSSSYCLNVFDLTTKTLTKIGTLSTLLNFTTSALSFSSASSCNINIVYYQGSPRLIIDVTGIDADSGVTKVYVLIYSFDATTQTFTLLKKHEVRHAPVRSRYCYQTNKYFYAYHLITSDTSAPTGNDSVVLDLATGELVSTTCIDFQNLSYTYNVYNDAYFTQGVLYDYNNATSNVITDTALFRIPLYLFSLPTHLSNPNGSITVHKNIYYTANWTTHNKLSAPITKTDQTTMKIQYDIVFDSIPETIAPALL